MAAAGTAIAWLSMPGALIFDGVLFLAAGCFALMIRLPHQVNADSRSISMLGIWRDMRIGFLYVWSRKPLCLIYTIQLLVMVSFMTVPILVAPFAMKVLKVNVVQFGMLEASLSVGMIVGSLIMPWLAELFGLLRLVAVLLVVLAVGFALFGYNRHIAYADGLNVVIGLALGIWPLIMTRAQEMTCLDYQGRVQSTFNCLAGVIILWVYYLVNMGSHWITIPGLYWFEVGFALVGLMLVFFGRRYLKA